MKPFIAKLLLLSIFVLGINSLGAQTLNKKSLISDLNNTEGVKLSPQQQKDYESSNNKLAGDLLNMDKSSKSKDDRDKEVDRLFDKRDNDIDNLFGKDSKYDETRKSMKKTSNKMRRKVKLAKLVV
jgi:predicted oxidoreductase